MILEMNTVQKVKWCIWTFASQFGNALKSMKVSYLGQVKLVNCNQIRDLVADENWITTFHTCCVKQTSVKDLPSSMCPVGTIEYASDF